MSSLRDQTIVCLYMYILDYLVSYLYRASRIAWFSAAKIQCFHRVKIAKITFVLCNLKNPVSDGWLRLPNYTKYQTPLCDEVIFQLCSTRFALKVIQIKWGLKFETKILKPSFMISICQICEAIVTNSWFRQIKVWN